MPSIAGKFVDLTRLNARELSHLPNTAFRSALEAIMQADAIDRKECQILRYQPASPRARLVHQSKAKLLGIGGGNGASKTETALIEPLAMACGVLPNSVRELFLPRFRGPVNVRIVVQSITTVLDNIILPKLMWNKWTGVDMPGGERGHWGWIPKMCLKDASWEKSYSKQNRTLTVLCRNPKKMDEVVGESQIQFMSHDQDASDAASGDFHYIVLDEPPKYSMFRESQARTMRVNGRIILAMTWPDDPTIPVDWIFDEIYEPGQPGPKKAPGIDWLELWTEENKNLDQIAIAEQKSKWSDETQAVRLYGRPIRFSNRIHPLFTDIPQCWSMQADKPVMPIDGKCPITGSSDLVDYCHVEEFDTNPLWPTVFLLDPHPRKPHMFMWVQVDPSDDYWVVMEGEEDVDPIGLRQAVFDTEKGMDLKVGMRLIDPNMGASPSSSDREKTWASELEMAGLACDLADDSDVGRKTINEYLRVDKRRRQPRLHIHPRCHMTVYQLKRYVWDNYRRQEEKDLKQIPRTKYDDYPTLLKYLHNAMPTFRGLRMPSSPVRFGGTPFAPAPKRSQGAFANRLNDRV